MERLKNKVLGMNLKKCVAVLAVVGVIFGVGAGIAAYWNFGGRILQIAEYERQQKEEWRQNIEQYGKEAGEQQQMHERGWRGHDGYYRKWDNQGRESEDGQYGYSDYEWEQAWNFSMGDRVLIGVLFGILLLLGAVYWLLCMAWAYQKADRLDSNRGLWTSAAMFFNLWAIMALYGYSLVNGTCTNCGRLKKRNEKYCSRCGTAYQQECSRCHASFQNGTKFCPNCGEAMKEDSSDTTEQK